MSTRPFQRLSLSMTLAAVFVALVVPAVPASAVMPADPANLDQADGGGPLAEGGVTNESQLTFSADVTDPDNDPTPTELLRLQVEVKPVGTPLDGTDLIESGTVVDGATASVQNDVPFPAGAYHWQARTIDENNETSGWVGFGTGTGFDFRVNAAPDDPTDLAQSAFDEALAEGGVTNDTTPAFSGTVTDPDNDDEQTDTLSLEIEIQPAGTPFDEDPTVQTSEAVNDGATATLTASELLPGRYHWRARTADEHGAVSGWVNFGVLEIDEDFRVNAVPNAPTSLEQRGNGTLLASGGITNDTTPEFSAIVTDPDNTPTQTDTLQLQVEVKPSGTAFDGTVSETSTATTEGDRAAVTPTLAPGRYHWAARTIDQHGATSQWVAFGVVTVDVRVNAAPAAPASLEQVSNDVGSMVVGAYTNDTSIEFRAVVSDPDNATVQTDTVQIEVEVKPTTSAFTGSGVGVQSSLFVTEGQTATTTITGLSPNASYHWRVRAIDEHGGSSAWVSFGSNPESAIDFRIPQADLAVDHELPTPVSASSGATTRYLAFSFTVTNAGPDAATSVTIDETFDTTVVDPTTARWELNPAGPCPSSPSNTFGAGDTISVPSLAVGSHEYCVKVALRSSPSPLIDGPLTGSNSISVSSPVFDPNLADNSDSDTTSVLTTPAAPRNVIAYAGNESAVVTWQKPSSDSGATTNDGGSTITKYVVTVERIGGGSAPGPFDVTVASPTGDPVYRLAIGDDVNEALINGQTYRFHVEAVNAVGTGPSTPSATIVPSLDASAEIIDTAGGNSVQTTGVITVPNTCALPTDSDPVTACQQFGAVGNGNANGVGSLLERPQTTGGFGAFCGASTPCMGSEVIQYELSGEVNGRVIAVSTYSKQVAGSTGVKFKVFYDSDGTKNGITPVLLSQCPKAGPSPTAPACVLKIVRLGPSNVGRNPDLQVSLSIPAADASDPLSGTRK